MSRFPELTVPRLRNQREIGGGAHGTMRTALGWGLAYGALVWAAMTFVGLPLVNDVMSDRMAMQPAWWAIYHLLFGTGLVFTPVLARSLSERKHPRGAAPA